jgi:hypothetical protein
MRYYPLIKILKPFIFLSQNWTSESALDFEIWNIWCLSDSTKTCIRRFIALVRGKILWTLKLDLVSFHLFARLLVCLAWDDELFKAFAEVKWCVLVQIKVGADFVLVAKFFFAEKCYFECIFLGCVQWNQQWTQPGEGGTVCIQFEVDKTC